MQEEKYQQQKQQEGKKEKENQFSDLFLKCLSDSAVTPGDNL